VRTDVDKVTTIANKYWDEFVKPGTIFPGYALVPFAANGTPLVVAAKLAELYFGGRSREVLFAELDRDVE